MTKEELKQEAEEYYEDETEGTFQICEDCYWFADAVQTAYVDSAEPREKRIAELEKKIKALGKRCLQLQKDKGKLIDYNKKLLQENTDQHNKIVLLSKKVNDLQKENAKVEEIKANADYQLEGRDNEIADLEAQIEKMKKYIKACWVEENLNDYSSYITNSSDEFRDLVKEINDEVRNGR